MWRPMAHSMTGSLLAWDMLGGQPPRMWSTTEEQSGGAGRDETRRDAAAAGGRRLPPIHPSQRPRVIHHSEFLPVNSYISSSVASFSPPYLVWLRLLDLSLPIPFNTSCLWFGSALSISRQVLWFYSCNNLQLSFIQGRFAMALQLFFIASVLFRVVAQALPWRFFYGKIGSIYLHYKEPNFRYIP